MYCKYCGNNMPDGSTLCKKCGRKVEPKKTIYELNQDPNEKVGPWNQFAKIGYVLGVISMSFGVAMIGIITGPFGIIFSCLGKKSKKFKNKAKSGLSLSIAGLIISFVMLMIFVGMIIAVVIQSKNSGGNA